MRTLIFLILLFPLISFAGGVFDLQQLSTNAQKHLAPEKLKSQFASEMKEVLSQCVSEPKWGLKDAKDFFAAVPIRLSVDKEKYLLVYSTKYCPGGLFGAHSVPFWIVRETTDGRYKTILFATTDRIKVLKRVTNGLSDIQAIYGNKNAELYWFDGNEYSYDVR
jgi:hypothetical protein